MFVCQREYSDTSASAIRRGGEGSRLTAHIFSTYLAARLEFNCEGAIYTCKRKYLSEFKAVNILCVIKGNCWADPIIALTKRVQLV